MDSKRRNNNRLNQTGASVITTSPQKNLSELTYDNKFNYDFCSCCVDCKLCCCGTFCLPCLVCDMFQDAKEGSCSACWQCFTLLWPCSGFCWSNLSMLRTKIRGAYKLHGSVQEDILYSGICPCCAAIQLKLEMRSQGITI
ncbi:cornifelin -like protein [Brachionus plicatilis]|uniref:Cornifelin-like protein n=1 Tax=Brachionus plicatilis TaxID=10195 RepID=A0A3M7RH70_BRAPC|nr:cornifelin -like protein [Brachionus plicatilis]